MRLQLHSKPGVASIVRTGNSVKDGSSRTSPQERCATKNLRLSETESDELLTTSPRGTTGPEGDGLLPRHWVAAVICADTPGAFSQHAVLAYCTE